MKPITLHRLIDSILESHQKELGNDYDRYRNHVYRVLNYSLPHLKTNEELHKMAIAAAFHDIGIWTNHTFDYLSPSIELAHDYCKKQNIDGTIAFEIEQIIANHHKLTSLKSSKLAEIFRKADLTDLTFGSTKTLSKEELNSIKRTFPYCGFHRFLVKLFLKNLIKHPLHPFPIFKI